jgi:hypothetical protein
MSQFELITLTYSFVLGLSMSHLLWAAASAVRARNELQLHWLPFAWAAGIFFVHVQYWFAAFAIDMVVQEWTWSWYLHLLGLGVLLFASGALVLPSASEQRVGSLIEDFREHGRLGLIPLAAYFFLWIPTSYRIDRATFDAGNIANLILTLLVLLAFRARKMSIQTLIMLFFALVLTWATVFVWAQDAM